RNHHCRSVTAAADIKSQKVDFKLELWDFTPSFSKTRSEGIRDRKILESSEQLSKEFESGSSSRPHLYTSSFWGFS
ncbi:hypothetical protein HAX54_038393, partial [Datura stramonium]|nr:hypothetical protein [Datura stramonium]